MKPPVADDSKELRLYGMIEAAAADPDSYELESMISELPFAPRQRRPYLSIDIDAIDAAMFDADVTDPRIDNTALSYVRVSTTPNRLRRLPGMDVGLNFGELPVDEGDWVEFVLKTCRSTPRAWRFDARNGYAIPTKTNLVRLAKITDPTQISPFENACRPTAPTFVSAEEALKVFVEAVGKQSSSVEIRALDVGQGAAVGIFVGDRLRAFFDAGAPTPANSKSLAKPPFRYVSPKGGVVLLSHWDWDHYALGLNHMPGLKKLPWFAPYQGNVSFNAAHFQSALGSNLHFMQGDASLGPWSLARCNGSPNNRNGSGYALLFAQGPTRVLLPGDADYGLIPPHMTQSLSSLMLTHHCGGRATPPIPAMPFSLGVASFGVPNVYKHPTAALQRHSAAQWRIERTSDTPNVPRGDRVLHPVRTTVRAVTSSMASASGGPSNSSHARREVEPERSTAHPED